jgi:hypothetical protein
MRGAGSLQRVADPCGAVLSCSRSRQGQVSGCHQKMRCRLRGCSRSRSRGPLCFAAPEIVVGAVIVIGAVVVAAAIQEGIDAYQRNASRERAKPKAQTQPAQEPLANRTPKPKDHPPETSSPHRQKPAAQSVVRAHPGAARGRRCPA